MRHWHVAYLQHLSKPRTRLLCPVQLCVQPQDFLCRDRLLDVQIPSGVEEVGLLRPHQRHSLRINHLVYRTCRCPCLQWIQNVQFWARLVRAVAPTVAMQ